MSAVCKRVWHDLGFSGEPACRFTLPQAKWPLAPILWCIYRIFLSVYLTVWLILVLVEWGHPPHYSPTDRKATWLIYATNWSFLVLILYLIIMAIGNIYYHLKHGCRNAKASKNVDPESKPDPGGMRAITVAGPSSKTLQEDAPWYFKFAWFLQSIAFATGFLVTLFFLIAGLGFNFTEEKFSVYSLHVHGVNVIIILLDMILAATPVRVLHLIYPSMFGLVYFIFTLIYEAAGGLGLSGGTAIYPSYLDWDMLPVRTAVVMALGVVVAIPVVHMMWYLVYRLRIAISESCKWCCWTY